MPLVLSDSSSLIHLAAIGRLSLLREIFQKIAIPSAVWREVVELGNRRAGAAEVEAARATGWIEVIPSTNTPLVQLLKRDLDEGEAEVLALAIERKADLVLLDETEARKVAELYGLPKTGVIGLLIRARRDGKIRSLREELDKLRNQAGFWIADKLYQQALRAVGEID